MKEPFVVNIGDMIRVTSEEVLGNPELIQISYETIGKNHYIIGISISYLIVSLACEYTIVPNLYLISLPVLINKHPICLPQYKI